MTALDLADVRAGMVSFRIKCMQDLPLAKRSYTRQENSGWPAVDLQSGL